MLLTYDAHLLDLRSFPFCVQVQSAHSTVPLISYIFLWKGRHVAYNFVACIRPTAMYDYYQQMTWSISSQTDDRNNTLICV
jgi:hypothetical protein